jgi:glycosyltransferase involved in cell wall biosynthesis
MAGRPTSDDEPAALHLLVPATRRDLDPNGPRVSVVIPAKNEARNLPWLAARMPQGTHEIILVDGDSRDATVEQARWLWPDVHVVTQTRPGKGNALACGFAAVTGDITVMIDADGSMDPGEIPYYVDALVAGADYVKGSRFVLGAGSHDITRVRRVGNAILNWLTNLAYDARFTDLCYGYNAFWTLGAHVFDLQPGAAGQQPASRQWGDGFEIETLLNIRAHRAGLTIAEVASFESPRLHGTSNLNTVKDGLRVLRTIGTERRRRPRRLPAQLPVTWSRARQPGLASQVSVVGKESVPALAGRR